jgi:hypothetical protein
MEGRLIRADSRPAENMTFSRTDPYCLRRVESLLKWQRRPVGEPAAGKRQLTQRRQEAGTQGAGRWGAKSRFEWLTQRVKGPSSQNRCVLASLHCFTPICSQAAKVLVDELPREAFWSAAVLCRFPACPGARQPHPCVSHSQAQKAVGDYRTPKPGGSARCLGQRASVLESPACWRCRKAWGGLKAGASSTHSKRFAQFGCGFAALQSVALARRFEPVYGNWNAR